MSFIAVLFALLIEQARPLGRSNVVHASLRAWIRWSSRNFDTGRPLHGWLAWGFAVVGPALISLLIYVALLYFVGWPLAMLWSVAVLYVTLGFRQFSFHFTQIRDALADGDEALARQLLLNGSRLMPANCRAVRLFVMSLSTPCCPRIGMSLGFWPGFLFLRPWDWGQPALWFTD